MADTKPNIFKRIASAISSKENQVEKKPQANFSTGLFRPLFATGYTGEKNLGELGPVKNYIPTYEILRMRSWQSYFEGELSQIVYNRLRIWVIGKGLKLQCEPSKTVLESEGINIDVQEFCKITEARFNVYRKLKSCDYAGMCNLDQIASEVYKNAKIGGDVLVVLRYIDKKLSVQIIDGEHVMSETYGTEYFPKVLENGNRVMNGVEVDGKNSIQAYWVRSWQNSNTMYKYERIPARSAETGLTTAFLVYGSKYRIDNKRGMPVTSTVLETMKKLERYKEATVGSAEERQKIPFTIEHGKSSTGETPLIGRMAKAHDYDAPDNDQLPKDIEGKELANTIAVSTNKSVFNMPIDSKLAALESKNELYFKDFYGVNIDIICASVMIPPNVAMSKYETSFSSSRAALKDWEHTLHVERYDFQCQFYQPFYDFWQLTEILNNKIQAPGYLAALKNNDEIILGSYRGCRFVGAQVPHIDPLKEVNAERAKLGSSADDLPLTTVEAATEALSGGESESNMEQYAIEFQRAKDLKISTPSKENIDALSEQLKDGAITLTEYRDKLGLIALSKATTVAAQEEKIKESQIQIRSTVGGTEGLIALNAAVANGETTRASAIAIIINIYGFDETIASSMVGDENVKSAAQEPAKDIPEN